MAGTKLPKDVGQSMRESVTAKAEATVEALVGMIERGELRLPEMQRRYVWRSTRVRDLPRTRCIATTPQAQFCSGRPTGPSRYRSSQLRSRATPTRAHDSCSTASNGSPHSRP